MKLDNKGFSLMELLVSIVLVSIVLTFLFQLLVDLKNETNNNNFAYNNQVNRTEIIKTIQNDFDKYTLVGITDNSINKNILINFTFLNGDSKKMAILKNETKTSTNALGEEEESQYLKYVSFDGTEYAWRMNGATIDPCGLFTYYIDDYSNDYYFKLNLYLYNNPYHERNNKNLNNAVDDIELTFIGNKEYLEFNDSNLTNNTKGYKKIGTCTD